MAAATLAQTQHLLWKLITAPEGAAAGLQALDPAECRLADGLVRPRGDLSAIERIDIYADMYFYRLRDCVQEDFAAVHAVVGAQWFHNLITDYLVAHPPAHFSLRQAGRDLPAFIETHRVATRWPFLGQLASLEWAVLEAFDAPDATPVDIVLLQDIPAEDWPGLRFTLTPSLQRLHTDWRVDDVLRGIQDGAPPPPPAASPTSLRVWRQDFRVFHRPVDAPEAAALAAVLRTETFAGMCAAVGELIGEAAGAERVVQILDTWFSDGLVVELLT